MKNNEDLRQMARPSDADESAVMSAGGGAHLEEVSPLQGKASCGVKLPKITSRATGKLLEV